MKTSSFGVYSGEGRVSIARFAPRWTPAGYKVYSKLAPGPWFNSVPEIEYRRLFQAEILAPLDPATVWRELHELVGPFEPVLLCWERLKPENEKEFCHRRLVSEWFKEKLDFDVPEIVVVKRQTGPTGALEL